MNSKNYAIEFSLGHNMAMQQLENYYVCVAEIRKRDADR